MTTRIFDAQILNAQGALVDFTALMRQQGRGNFAVADIKRRSLLLRWQTSPAVGLPTEPFKVWRRPALPLAQDREVEFDDLSFWPYTILQFAEPLASARIIVHSNTGGTVMVGVLIGPPSIETLTAVQSKALPATGSAAFDFSAPLITGLLIYNASGFDTPRGVTLAEAAKLDKWELVETVGLPVDEGDWANLGQRHGTKQGPVGGEMPAFDAALDRYKRGINPLGWWPVFPDGTPAPGWTLPDPVGLIKESAAELLPMLHDVAALPPQQQAAKLFNFTIKPPQNPAGDVMPASNPGKAQLSPIGLLAMAAASDPLTAVVLGYGTGFPDQDIPPVVFGDRSFFGDPTRSDWDWLVTGLWEKGLDGQSDPVEYAALVPRPGLAIPAPPPADFHVDLQANLRPAKPDLDWIGSVRASWERFPQTQLASVASFAAARQRVGTGAAAEALLKPHDMAGGHHPIANARNDRDPEPTRQSATDGTLTIPNDPGHVPMTYAAATQNIFGLWSPWVQAGIDVGQPPLPQVQFLAADLRAHEPAGGTLCNGTLVCEISVDWRVRSPAAVNVQGLLFAAATRSADPPAIGFPAGVQMVLGAAPVATQISFAGDVPSLAGGTVECLSADGTKIETGGPAQGTSRRYRVTLPGFKLDYAGTPHMGIVLQAQMVELISPHNPGPWTAIPRRAYASDPRALPTVVDIVQLASLPDAAGEAHVHLSWNAIAGAIGYAVYESTETRILTSHPGNPEPTPERTLSQRLTTIKAAFASDPIRRDFTRKNAELLPGTAIDLTMPRGSKDIHVYVVLPVMGGGKEGPWPSGPDADDALIAYAAPKVAEPAPPTIEVEMRSNKAPAAPDYRTHIKVMTRGGSGAPPKRIDLHRVRVDDAARTLDSMGPPIATLTATGGGWTVNPPEKGGNWIASVEGDDRPTGSWRRVWYRAVAWSEDDAQRGVLRGRSRPSPAVPVMVPPAGPPDLSPLSMSWPGGDPAAVLVRFTSTAQITPTPLGPHLLSVDVTPAGAVALLSRKTALDKVGTAEPAAGTDVWRVDGSTSDYHLLVRRTSINDAVSVIVRITDPLGRVSEQTLAIPAGSLIPLPFLSPISASPLPSSTKVYAFTTDAPNSNSTGVYRLHIELTPALGGGIGRDIDPGFGRGRGRNPGPIIIGPRPPASQFRLINGVYVFDEPLSAVPSVSGPPANGSGLLVVRQSDLAKDHFAIASSIKLGRVLVRIVTPDGRTVEQKSRG